MAIAANSSSSTMTLGHSHSQDDAATTNTNTTTSAATNKPDDDHDHDVVMPGFRFHPTEEELVEFYLRRKVEGKRFNVELITFLDLYRYDPWELPALAAIGEKEWYFYVPRDRKYRNGDRPNRVTMSGYWKATGADRMIKTENFRSIGLKKTLVFYSGKAPKGIRTSWIMNEYRLPHHETERYQKTEISLCRVYKRPGVEDHPSLPRCLPIRPSLSRASYSDKNNKHNGIIHQNVGFVAQSPQIEQIIDKINEAEGSSTAGSDVTTALGLSQHNNIVYSTAMGALSTTMGLPAVQMEDEGLMLLQQQSAKQAQAAASSSLIPATFFGPADAASSVSSANATVEYDLNRLLSYQQQYYNVQSDQQLSNLPMQSQPVAFNSIPNSLPTTFPDRLWEWNPIPETNREYSNMSFK
ncbi:hypothetical protein L6164_032402 [Bauhinia variegata]|uniref:Uncharacterized protein n=1 Tax=Bauhinia variegata TaxID=167791 RepID=A0ACB9KNP1_BAUVA|nr:hypothetical protein L6164_032402 [Bauhinia variegata]